MFLITQLIGLFIFTTYNQIDLPYDMQPPKEIQERPQGIQIITAFVIAILLFFLLIKIRAEIIIKAWFFAVITLALGIAINAILISLNLIYYTQLISLLIALPLTYLKVFKRDLIVHNTTELLIYPGIAAVFISLLNINWTIILLLIISLYDIWAVWHSEVMQKMAKYQINNLRIFTGFFIPYASKKEKQKIKELKEKYSSNELEKQFRKSNIKINLAILGGGDVIFPIIAAGVFYKVYNSIIPSLIITLFSTLALLYLFVVAKKGKFYPAMPFITIGIYLAMIVIKIVF